MNAIVAGAVALVVAVLLHLSLDARGDTPRLFSMPLLGLALIFGVRAWTASVSNNVRSTRFFAGLAAGVGAYAIIRLFII